MYLSSSFVLGLWQLKKLAPLINQEILPAPNYYYLFV